MNQTGSLANSIIIALIVAALLLCGCINARGDSANTTEPAQPVTPAATLGITGKEAGSSGSQPLPALAMAPRIIPAGEAAYDYRKFNFRFQKEEYLLSIPVNISVYEGARNGSRVDTRDISSVAGQAGLCDYYAAMVEEPGQDELYATLSDSLQQIRRKANLDQDEYVELAMQFVQQIPADENKTLSPRFPVEVIGDRSGGCHEKTMLLLGLLSREGYDVAMLYFPEIDHSGAGIRIQTTTESSFPYYEYQGKKYLYIEPDHPAFLGECPNETHTLQPLIRPIGNGTLRYQGVNSAIRLVHSMQKLNATVTFMEEEIMRIDADVKNLTKKLRTEDYNDDDEALKDIVKRDQLRAKQKYYTESLEAVTDVYRFALANRHDARGVIWLIDNSKVLDIHYY